MARRRPLLLLAAALALGIAFGHGTDVAHAQLYPFIVAFIALMGSFVFLLLGRSRWVFGIFVVVLCLGLLRGSLATPDFSAIESSLSNIDSVEGVVVDYPAVEADRTKFTVLPLGESLKIAYTHFHQDRAPIDLRYGDRVEISAQLEVPENFGDFDYRQYLHSRSIVATASIWSYGGVHIIERNQGHFILQWGYEVRQRLFNSVDQAMRPSSSGLLKSLIFGDRTELNESTETAFRRSGVMHVLAVSGLHLGILIGLFFGIFRALRISFTGTYLLLVPIVLVYLVLVGFKLSLVRASMMLGFAALGWMIAERGWILRRWVDPLQGLSLAALIILIWTPAALFDVSFQLSFGATAGILIALDLFGPKLHIWRSRLEHGWNASGSAFKKRAAKLAYGFATFLLISLAAQIAVTPILGLQFNELHLTALLANVVVVPLATLAIWLSVAFLIFAQILAELSLYIAQLLEPLLDALMMLTSFFAQLPGAGLTINLELQLIALVILPLLLSWEAICWVQWQLERVLLHGLTDAY